MAANAVEWVLVVFYGPEAHRAAYGRQVQSNRYTKDYIQLSRKQDFIDSVTNLFAADSDGSGSVPLTYKWHTGSTPGAFVFNSADRPHLKWETAIGSPQVWKMSPEPSDVTTETIPGDPTHLDFDAAEHEREMIPDRGAGQPFLVVVKLKDEPRTLHLRVYLGEPAAEFAWANIALTPTEIQSLAGKTTRQRALQWSDFQSGGRPTTTRLNDALAELVDADDPNAVLDQMGEEDGKELLAYLRAPGYGLFFDPTKNHDAWSVAQALPDSIIGSVDDFANRLEARLPEDPAGDAVAENLEASPEEVVAFREQIENKNFEVDDSTATQKTRGSAQRAFSESVKANYGNRCAITGIANRSFLIGAHIVPWSKDKSIRLDPSNGICLSLIVDRAFEKGFLLIADDLTVTIDWDKVGDDAALRSALEPYDGKKLEKPENDEPNPEYLQRRRELVNQTD